MLQQQQQLQHFLDSALQSPTIKSSEPAGRPNSGPICSSPLDRAIDRHPLTVAPETPIAEVLALKNPMHVSCQLCSEKQNPLKSTTKRSCVLVVEDNRPIGIFTERDIIVKLTTVAACAVGLTIADVMTREPITLKQSESPDIFTAMFTLRQHQIRHLPVVDEDSRLLGIITREAIHEALQPVNLLTNLRCAADVMTHQVVSAP